MKKKRNKPSKDGNVFSRFAKGIDLPEFALGLNECIEIWGKKVVQIEGAKGIHTYEREVVKIQMKNYLLVLWGNDFDLAHFEDNILRVSGTLHRLEWEGLE